MRRGSWTLGRAFVVLFSFDLPELVGTVVFPLAMACSGRSI